MGEKKRSVMIHTSSTDKLKEIMAHWRIKNRVEGKITQGKVVETLIEEELKKLKNESEETKNEQNID
ncbi:hypothetical protein [Enterococcus faecalis]|uniref:hypothetical protein n=1 Tax=Enterococcus faecalis TaxID=1351 RepID=UPI002AFEEAA9|nr:hypothetical protein [Enterococcus faecalis]